MKNIEAKAREGFLILSIKEGEIKPPIGKATIDFSCPDCGERNTYEVNYKAIDSLFEKEKKCTKCGKEYAPCLEIKLKAYVKFYKGEKDKNE